MLLFFVCVAENRTFSFWIFLNQTFRFRFEKTVFSFCGFNIACYNAYNDYLDAEICPKAAYYFIILCTFFSI